MIIFLTLQLCSATKFFPILYRIDLKVLKLFEVAIKTSVRQRLVSGFQVLQVIHEEQCIEFEQSQNFDSCSKRCCE